MPETLEKLRPDRDLECYFERPSAIAAISEATAAGFVVSGTWRQQFDWAVVEWNRDNVIEHPVFRNLPDGDLSGLQLSYEETRTNCILLDSSLYPTVDWPYLRVWAQTGGTESVYKVPLKANAVPIEGAYQCAKAEFTLQGTLTPGDYIGLAWMDEQYNYQAGGSDTLESAAQAIVDAINTLSPTMEAERVGALIRLIYAGTGQTQLNSTTGADGNRLGAYGFVSGARTESWSPQWQTFSGGTSPAKWRITLNFADLRDIANVQVPTASIRKMRWTYAAAQQAGSYQRSEFQARVTNWQVTGTNRAYKVAGPGTRRLEDNAQEIAYSGNWGVSQGNFSGGTIKYTTAPGALLSCTYQCGQPHSLYLGTRLALNGASITATIDGGAPQSRDLMLPGEDVLVRMHLGDLAAGPHTVNVSHSGTNGSYFYFDFLEAAIAGVNPPTINTEPSGTLATDWDTDHSISVAAERTAWNIYNLGFRGRVNHYVGALWFYELVREGHQYASATVTFTGTPVFSETTQITINRAGQPPSAATIYSHLNLIGETASDVAKAFELVINNGSTGIWAQASGNVLTVYSRSMGTDGNQYTISASPATGSFAAQTSGSTFSGGVDGDWRTDLTASPRLNRAVRDWSKSFVTALKNYGLDITAAFSMELQHGDPSPAAGIAQRYPSGNAVLLNTPALQTNFSPQSLAFWKQVYLDMAAVMASAGVTPYLQFGEVQWWYFPYDGSGLPFHDAYTKDQFLAAYGFAIRAVPNGDASPSQYPEEVSLLPTLIGDFTSQVMSHVRAQYPTCRFEVLYPTDVNEGQFNRLINYPSTWTAASLDCLKTESFTYTYSRDLNKCLDSIRFSEAKGFPRAKRSHLIGLSDAIAPWLREMRLAKAEALESVVLFALDQFCLIGYPAPLRQSSRRSLKMG
ncbi:MAG: hypothetical protein HY235_01130 [Acidobacteria bacterium]|nr:hypothetical protein [Acidobacteriota bacterium]